MSYRGGAAAGAVFLGEASMSRRTLSAAVRGALFTVALLLPAVLAQAQQQQVASLPSAGSARVWFYRDYEPYVSRNYATVAINGAVAGSVKPEGGAIYRDLAPGRYHLTPQTVGTDVNQAVDIDLAPGQQAYVKILNAPSWESGGDMQSYQRDTYYLRLMPPDLAQAEIAQRPF
jgi:hypothetical protein